MQDRDYMIAKEIAQCLFDFPYRDPATVPDYVRAHGVLFEIIKTGYTTTGGGIYQTTLDAAERMRLQDEFKKVIYDLLEKCISSNPEHSPSMLLYVKVAEFNTRVRHIPSLIQLHERFLPSIDSVIKGTRGYALIKEDIVGLGGNCFDQVERYLADFHYDLACLYKKIGQDDLVKTEYAKANKLCSKIYRRGKLPQL